MMTKSMKAGLIFLVFSGLTMAGVTPTPALAEGRSMSEGGRTGVATTGTHIVLPKPPSKTPGNLKAAA